MIDDYVWHYAMVNGVSYQTAKKRIRIEEDMKELIRKGLLERLESE